MPGADLRRGIVDFDEGRVFLDVAAGPTARLRILIHFDHGAAELAVAGRVDRDLHRHARPDERNAGFVHRGFDLHFGGIRQPNQDLAFADRCPASKTNSALPPRWL